MPQYTGTFRWLNPDTHEFQPVTVRGLYRTGQGTVSLTYRDVYFANGIEPDPPIIVTARMDTATTSTVEWQDGYNTGNVQYYEVARNNVVVSGQLAATLQIFQETGLATSTPAPIYSYTVRAMTDQGLTDYSDPFPVQFNIPPPNRKPFPPTNFRINLATVTEVTADSAWDYSTDPNVLGFRLYKNGFPGQLIYDTLDAVGRTWQLTNLTPATAYTFDVRAYNSIGESNPSNQVHFTTQDPGGFVTRFPGHQAGLIYLGLYSTNAYGTEDTAIGTVTALDRIADSGVTGTVTQHVNGYLAKVDLAVQDGKIPWISVTPTHLGLTGTDQANWLSVTNGQAFAALEQYFDLIAELTADYAIFTFHPRGHVNIANDADAALYCDAIDTIGDHWLEYNNRQNGIYGPILQSNYFTQVQAGTRPPGWFINDTLLDNCDFLGIDLYQNNVNPPASFASTRLNYIVSQYQSLTTKDDIMLGLSEIGAANVFRNGGLYSGNTIPANSLAPTGAQWLNEALSYVFANRDRYFAVSYADTSGLSTSPIWGLDEAKVTTGAGTLDTLSKMEVYRGFINGDKIARQQGDTVVKAPSVTAQLDRQTYQTGDTMRLTVSTTVQVKWTATVTDSGVTWAQQSKVGQTAVYTAPAPSASGSHNITVRLTRTYDGRQATANATYSITAVAAGVGTLMGCSTSDFGHGGTEVWDAWRVYQQGELMDYSNRTGNQRPKLMCYSEDGPNLGGSNPNYNTILAHVRSVLDDYYYNGTGQTHSVRWGIKLYWSNGNENGDKGILGPDGRLNSLSQGDVDGYVLSMKALYDACHTIDSSTGTRRYPDAYAGSDPTGFQEQNGIVDQWLRPSGKYHDFVAWSMYPPGRNQTWDDPTYNWPSLNPADAGNLRLGYMIRCFERTKAAQTQARTDTGNPNFRIAIGVGEIGTGQDPGDSTTRPYYAVHALAAGFEKLCVQYQMDGPFNCWWDSQKSASGNPQDVLTDEPTNTNPSTRVAWQNWKSYNHEYGGSHPASWSGNPKQTGSSAWKTTGPVV